MVQKKEDTTDFTAIKRKQPLIHQESWAEGLTNELRQHLDATEKVPESLMWHTGWNCKQLCLSTRSGQYNPISCLQIWCSNNHLKFLNQCRILKLLNCLSLMGCIRWGQLSSNWIWTEIHWNYGLFQSKPSCDSMKHCLTAILFNEVWSQPGLTFS